MFRDSLNDSDIRSSEFMSPYVSNYSMNMSSGFGNHDKEKRIKEDLRIFHSGCLPTVDEVKRASSDYFATRYPSSKIFISLAMLTDEEVLGLVRGLGPRGIGLDGSWEFGGSDYQEKMNGLKEYFEEGNSMRRIN